MTEQTYHYWRKEYGGLRMDQAKRFKELKRMMIEAGKNIGSGRSLLAQDVLKGRKTEVNELNGYVVRKSREQGISTPVNKGVVKVTRKVKLREIEPSLNNLEYMKT